MDRRGWKTSEFWLNLLAVVVAYFAANGFGDDDASLAARIVGMLAIVLPALGYTGSRAVIKREALRVNGQFNQRRTSRSAAPLN